MAHKNLKIEKKKEYNPFTTRTIRCATVENVKCYLKAIKPNPINKFGFDLRKHDPDFDSALVYYYEVMANDGSYRKCTTKEDAELRFSQLVEFEKRQSVIN